MHTHTSPISMSHHLEGIKPKCSVDAQLGGGREREGERGRREGEGEGGRGKEEKGRHTLNNFYQQHVMSIKWKV